MKPLYCIALFLLGGWQMARAQQEQMYTLFMYNKLAWNPAYAGNFESPTLTAVYRNQFIGLSGAPKTVALSFNTPYNSHDQRLAFGVNLSQHSIGITRILNLDLIPISMRFEMRYGTLSAGIQVGIRQFSQNWNDKRIEVTQPNDGAIPVDQNSKIIVNPGFGVFYNSQYFYAGMALPRILGSNIDFSSIGGISREVQHLNAMSGYTFNTNDHLAITPQVLVKYAVHAPIQADFNVTMVLNNKFTGGLTYRTGNGKTSAAGESIDLLFGLQATEKFFFCVSYDLGLTPLQQYHHGSAELTARYWFNPPAANSDSPVSPY